MKAHVNSVCKSAYHQIRGISKIRRFLDDRSTKSVIHALVTPRFDINNALLAGLPTSTLNKLQRCQNVAARVVTRTSPLEHITPVLRDLHWLPIDRRIEFKILTQVYRVINGIAPAYLKDLIHAYKPSRYLRSSDSVGAKNKAFVG
jgi:hypothetical protein